MTSFGRLALATTALVVAFGRFAPRADAQNVLDAAAANQERRRGKVVTVEFVVKHAYPLIPGEKFRLLSESFAAEKNQMFVVQFDTEAGLKRLGVAKPERPFRDKDKYFDLLEEHFDGKLIRATGVVQEMLHSSTAQTSLGIVVDDPQAIEVFPFPSDVPPLLGEAIVADVRENDDQVVVALTIPQVRWQLVGEFRPKEDWPELRSTTTAVALNLRLGGPTQWQPQMRTRIYSSRDGKALSKTQIIERLTKRTPVLVSVSGKPVDPYYLQLMREDVLIVKLGGDAFAPQPQLLPAESVEPAPARKADKRPPLMQTPVKPTESAGDEANNPDGRCG